MELTGAIYLLKNLGERREDIFLDDVDRQELPQDPYRSNRKPTGKFTPTV